MKKRNFMKHIQAKELLQSLIEIESTSGNETHALLFLEKLLSTEKFVITRIPVRKNTFCLFATVGKPTVIFQAHVDTVPPYIPFSEDDQIIFGRGACDTKASIATMIVAAIEAKQKGLTDFGLLFTVEEEVSFQGALEAAKIFSGPLPYFIVGEPTSLQPITSHFGIDTFTIIAHGKSAHTSMPENGMNAIEILFSAYELLRKIQLAPGTLATVAQISGGIAPNIIPEHAQFVFSMRIAPSDETNYFEVIKKMIPTCEVKRGKFLRPVQSSLPPHLHFLGQEQTVRYCTELAFFRNGCILGPGDIRFAHSEDEQVNKSELDRAVEIYLKILENSAKRTSF